MSVNCDKIKNRELIDNLTDNEISDENKIYIEQHLTECNDCKRYYFEVLSLNEKISKLPKNVNPKTNIWKSVEGKLEDENIKITQISGNLFTVSNITEIKNDNTQNEFIKPKNYLKYAVAASIVLILGIFSLPFLFNKSVDLNSEGNVFGYWQVQKLKGNPTLSDKPLATLDSIREGEWIITDDSSEAMIKIEGIGDIIVEPKTKLRILKNEDGENKVYLEYGTINTNLSNSVKSIVPFAVQTANGIVRDTKGGSYTFTMNENGDGMIFVKDGIVNFVSNGKESVIPSGKVCIVQALNGPGVPFSVNTSPQFKNAIMHFDENSGDLSAINSVISTSGNQDLVSLINLMPRVSPEVQNVIYQRVQKLAPNVWIPKDSIKFFGLENLNRVIEECMEQSMKGLENLKELENLDKKIRVKIENDMKGKFDVKVFTDQLNEEIKGNLEKALEHLEKSKDDLERRKIIIKNNAKGFDFEFKFDTAQFRMDFEKNFKWNDEEFRKEFEENMEKLNEYNYKYEYKLNYDEIQKDLDDAKKDIEEAQEEIQRELKELEKERKQEEEKIKKESYKIEINPDTPETES